MRGKQVNAFLLPADTSELEQRLRAGPAFVAASGLKANGTLSLLPDLLIAALGSTPLRVYLVPPWLAVRSDLYSVAARHSDHIDSAIVPVVEFDRCYYDGAILRRGRLYGVPRPELLASEDAATQSRWLAWLEALLSTAKRGLVRRGSGEYIGRHAEQEERGGLRLVDM